MSGLNSLHRSREGNNISLGKPILAGNGSHPGKRLKEQVRWIGSVSARRGAGNVEETVSELEVGGFLHEDRGGLSHLRILSTGRFGSAHRGHSLPTVNRGLAA
jgi:hypothetical protein